MSVTLPHIPNPGSEWAKVLYPVHTRSTTLNQRLDAITRSSERWHINPVILWGVYGVETSHGADVTTSSAGAKGGFQFIAPTAAQYHYPYTNAQDPATFAKQADAAAHYLSDLLGGRGEQGLTRGKGGNWESKWEKALRSYSGGGYGLATVKQHAGAAKIVAANQYANTQETQSVNAPSKGSGLIAEIFAKLGNFALTGILLLAGALLVVYGIMVAVRPRERALSIPVPAR